MALDCLNFSLTRYQDGLLHKRFEAAGLESRMIDVDNGSRVHVWVPKNFTSPKDDNDTEIEKPVLVLLHGFGASATWQWQEQVKPLLAHFTLVLPDLLFFGKSITTNPDRTESFQAASMWLMLKALGIKKFSVCGSSYGGFVAYRLAQAHPDAVEKVILSNSSVCMLPEDDQALCKRGNAPSTTDLLLPTDRAGVNAVVKLAFSKPPSNWFIPTFVINDHIRVLYGENRAEKSKLLIDLVFGKEGAPALMSKVDKDILMVWGDNDQVFLLEQAERAKEYLGKRSDIVVLKDAGHVSQVEQPAQWNSVVIKFLLGTELE